MAAAPDIEREDFLITGGVDRAFLTSFAFMPFWISN